MKGHCLCGSVTIDAEPEENEVSGSGLSACHCTMCRRWSSGAFIEFTARPGSVAIKGPAKCFASSPWAERAFCSECGSPLWYRVTVENSPDQNVFQLSAGLFDYAAGLELTFEGFIDRKPDGYRFAGEHKTMTAHELEALYSPEVSITKDD